MHFVRGYWITKSEDQVLTVENISARSRDISKNILKDFSDISKSENKTYGIKQYLDHGFLGAEEACPGFHALSPKALQGH